MSDKSTGRGSDQFPLRLPEGMREQIRAAAEASGRSMNAEIVNRLQASFEPALLVTLLQATLPPGMFDALKVGSAIHQVPIEERLSQILAESLSVDSEYDKLHIAYMEMADQKHDLEEQVRILRTQIAREFFAHLSHLAQSRVFLSIVSESLKKGRPEEIMESVETLLEVATVELDALRAKREELYGKDPASHHTQGLTSNRQALDQGTHAAENQNDGMDSDRREWDWENSKADAPLPVEKPTKKTGKRQKR